MKQKLAGLFLLFPLFLGAQPLVEKLDTDDISSAIKMLGIEIFKYDFCKQAPEYNLVITKAEKGQARQPKISL